MDSSRHAVVSIRKLATTVTPPIWGYEITLTGQAPVRGTINDSGGDWLFLAYKVLRDHFALPTPTPQERTPDPAEKL